MIERETLTEGDGTKQPARGRPALTFGLALLAALACAWSLAEGLAGGPDPSSLQSAMLSAFAAVALMARGDAALRGDA